MSDGVYLNELEPYLTGLFIRVQYHANRLGVSERKPWTCAMPFHSIPSGTGFDLVELLLALADRLELLERSVELIEGRRDE